MTPDQEKALEQLAKQALETTMHGIDPEAIVVGVLVGVFVLRGQEGFVIATGHSIRSHMNVEFIRKEVGKVFARDAAPNLVALPGGAGKGDTVQ